MQLFRCIAESACVRLEVYAFKRNQVSACIIVGIFNVIFADGNAAVCTNGNQDYIRGFIAVVDNLLNLIAQYVVVLGSLNRVAVIGRVAGIRQHRAVDRNICNQGASSALNEVFDPSSVLCAQLCNAVAQRHQFKRFGGRASRTRSARAVLSVLQADFLCPIRISDGQVNARGGFCGGNGWRYTINRRDSVLDVVHVRRS